MTAKIHLKNLKTNALIGVWGHEREKKQPLIIDLALEIDTTLIEKADVLESTTNYREIVNYTLEFVESSKFYLLERLGIELAQKLLKKFNLTSVHLKIQKPFALKDLTEVSFEYFEKA